MATETWPDSSVDYEYPTRTPVRETRWRRAINEALSSGSLRLLPVDSEADLYNLAGQCPRCGHDMDQSIEFSVIMGTLPERSRFGIFNVNCNCTGVHDGRDDKHKGCGWGGPIAVPLYVH